MGGPRAALRRDHRDGQAQGRAQSQDGAAQGRRHRERDPRARRRRRARRRAADRHRRRAQRRGAGAARRSARRGAHPQRARDGGGRARADVRAAPIARAALGSSPRASWRRLRRRQRRERLARETALFAARRRTLDEQIASLEIADRATPQAQAAALTAQIEATEHSARLAAEELEINDRLARQGFVHRTRMLAARARRRPTTRAARRRVAAATSPLARQRAGDLARAHRAGAQPLPAAGRRRVREESAARCATSKSACGRPRSGGAPIVRAPVDGQVMALRVSAARRGHRRGEPILDIVPTQRKARRRGAHPAAGHRPRARRIARPKCGW